MPWPEGEGNEGKVMGLAPFGAPDALRLPELDVRGRCGDSTAPPTWLPGGHAELLTRYPPGIPAALPVSA
jgi:carbamoyltransferase